MWGRGTLFPSLPCANHPCLPTPTPKGPPSAQDHVWEKVSLPGEWEERGEGEQRIGREFSGNGGTRSGGDVCPCCCGGRQR